MFHDTSVEPFRDPIDIFFRAKQKIIGHQNNFMYCLWSAHSSGAVVRSRPSLVVHIVFVHPSTINLSGSSNEHYVSCRSRHQQQELKYPRINFPSQLAGERSVEPNMSRKKKAAARGNGGNSTANNNAAQGNVDASSDAKAKKEQQKAIAKERRRINRRKTAEAKNKKEAKEAWALHVRRTHSFKPYPSVTHGGAGYDNIYPGNNNLGRNKKNKISPWHSRREAEIMDMVYDESIGATLPIDENRHEIPPWVTSNDDRPLDIWKEMIDFSQFCSLTDAEKRRRQSIVDNLTSIIHDLWPKATVQVFGSFATGLSIIGSDIDIVVTGVEREAIGHHNGFPNRREDAAADSADESEELISIEAGDRTERDVSKFFHERRKDETNLNNCERTDNTNANANAAGLVNSARNDMPLVFIDRVGDAKNGEVTQSSAKSDFNPKTGEKRKYVDFTNVDGIDDEALKLALKSDASNNAVAQSGHDEPDANIDENETRKDVNPINKHVIPDADLKSAVSGYGSNGEDVPVSHGKPQHERNTDNKTKEMTVDNADEISNGTSKGSVTRVGKDVNERPISNHYSKCGDRLEILASALRRNRDFAKQVITVPMAKVPLVKFTATYTQAINSEATSISVTGHNTALDYPDSTSREEIACDVSFDCVSGVGAVPVVESMLNEYPEARPLFLVVKALISQKKLNEVATGGLGSYALFIMVISHLQQWEMNFKDIIPFEHKQLRLLDSFFQLYGLALPVDEVGMSIRSPGTYYQRKERYPNRPIRHYPNGSGLSIEDPVNETNELATNCYRLRVIRDLFTNAAKVLANWCPSPVEGATFTSTPLSSIIRISQQMRDRRPLVTNDAK